MRSRSLITRFAILVLVVLVPLSALAGNEVGKLNGNGGGVEWSVTRSGHDSITLVVVASDGTTYEKTFNGGQNPSFRTSDLKKSGATDGIYSYELRVNPKITGAVKAALKAARETGDDAKVSEIQKANGLTSQVVQSGFFSVTNGSFNDPNAAESDANDSAAAPRGAVSSSVAGRQPGGVATDDQVIPDDLIVQSSTCTGFDCVNGESFGFDTLRLKENNLRIHFDDTSTSAGFPANDWRFVANDSGSGGGNFMAIEDSTAARNIFVAEAGSPTNALYVDSTGNIGISQSAPALDLHITTTDTPAMRYEQTSAGGFTAQTWDIGANEANFFVRDVTGGSRLSFRIRPGAPTSSIDIAADGDVGVGTASPDYRMEVVVNTNGESLGIAAPNASSTISSPGITFEAGSGTNASNRNWGMFSNYASAGDFAIMHSTAVNTLPYGQTATMVLTSGNSVGIGTNTPSSKLHVNGGDIRVSSGSFIDDGVTLNVPDYVFEDSYKLLSMDELSSFIKTNKHLPNVPSAKDIASKGVNLSKFQMNLLEKVEELTLYTVAQHEQIGNLKAQNDQLMARLAALEAAVAKK